MVSLSRGQSRLSFASKGSGSKQAPLQIEPAAAEGLTSSQPLAQDELQVSDATHRQSTSTAEKVDGVIQHPQHPQEEAAFTAETAAFRETQASQGHPS